MSIDYILAPINTVTAISNCEIWPAFLSDHCIVAIDLELDEAIRGKGLWKLNTKHLANKEYVGK